MKEIGRWKEDFKKYVELFEKYFLNGGNGMCDISPENNSIYVFCTVKHDCKCDNNPTQIIIEDGFDSVASPVWEWIRVNNPVPPFFRVKPNEFVHRLCSKSNPIILNSLVVGEYCPKRNILLTTDWTHSYEDQFYIVRKILKSLK
jgi:hypothetical protein